VDCSHCKYHAQNRRIERRIKFLTLKFLKSFQFLFQLTRLLQAINGKVYFPLLFIAATTTPLQGMQLQPFRGESGFAMLLAPWFHFLTLYLISMCSGLPNFLVYLYPRYRKARKEKPEAGVVAWLKSSIAPDAPVSSTTCLHGVSCLTLNCTLTTSCGFCNTTTMQAAQSPYCFEPIQPNREPWQHRVTYFVQILSGVPHSDITILVQAVAPSRRMKRLI
jgi:hypothetical protein